MEYKDYYKTLNVERTATPDQIKQSYRKLARKFHPDVSKEPNAEEKFKAVQEAYEVLKDPQKREAYDQLGSQWQGGQEFRPPPNWQGFSGFEGFGGGDEGMGGFSDFFESIFGAGGGRGGARAHPGFRGGAGSFDRRGRDQHAKITISLEEAFRGGNKTIQLEVPEVDAMGHVQHKLRTLKITIPAGTVSGQQMRLAKQGLPGTGKAPPGDLYLEIDVQSHRYFTLQGRDVYLTLPITPWEAALGAKVTAPTLAGPVDVKIATGSQTGQKLRLKGRGLPGKPNAGDQYILLQIATPPAKTEAEKALYEKMAQEMPFNPRLSLT
jgi:curved DNA-binding protein